MRREIPIAICFLAGFSFILEYFIPHKQVLSVFETIRQWAIIVIAFAYVLGIANIVRINFHAIQRKQRDWPYKVVLVLGVFFMITVGVFFGGIGEETIFGWVYYHAQYPLQATMFSLLAFFVASASYRAFRARTAEATLLLGAAIVVMLGRVPLGHYIWDKLPQLGEWIMDYPNMAGQRAIMIGIALGVASTSLRIILGIERTYLAGK